MSGRVAVSDLSVIIDLERGGLVAAAFALSLEFCVPDLLYRRELQPEFRVTSGRRAGLASRLLAFSIPRFTVGRGIAYLLDTATGPPPLVFSLAAEEICSDSVVDDTIIHQEPVPVGAVCDSGSVHDGSMIGRPWNVNFSGDGRKVRVRPAITAPCNAKLLPATSQSCR